MENPIGLGGITLVLAAVVWLVVFVPGFSKRSQLREATSLVRSDTAKAKKAAGYTPDERLGRLLATQRGFSLLFALTFLGAIATAIAAIADSAWWLGFYPLLTVSIFSLLIQRAAGVQAAKLASARHSARQDVRSQAAKRRPESAADREWTPNPLPAPLNQPKIGEIAAPSADVIAITRPSNSLQANDIDAILARRRAI